MVSTSLGCRCLSLAFSASRPGRGCRRARRSRWRSESAARGVRPRPRRRGDRRGRARGRERLRRRSHGAHRPVRGGARGHRPGAADRLPVTRAHAGPMRAGATRGDRLGAATFACSRGLQPAAGGVRRGSAPVGGRVAVRRAARRQAHRRPARAPDRRTRPTSPRDWRVAAAAGAMWRDDAAALGRLLDESHESQRQLFEVSTPAIDRLAALTRECGALGARLTGGGFGGSVVAWPRWAEAARSARRRRPATRPSTPGSRPASSSLPRVRPGSGLIAAPPASAPGARGPAPACALPQPPNRDAAHSAPPCRPARPARSHPRRSRSGYHPACPCALEQLALWKALGHDEAGQHHSHVHAVRALLEVQRVIPTAQRELARRVAT